MKYQGKSMMSLNEMARLAIDYEGDGYVTGYPIVSGNDTYILNGVIEANEEYITINQWVPVFPESLKPVPPSLNENQQIVLEYLKGMCPAKLGVSAMVTAYCLVDDNINDNWQEYSDEIPEHIEALQELSVAEENQVLEVFSRWVQEQEEKQ